MAGTAPTLGHLTARLALLVCLTVGSCKPPPPSPSGSPGVPPVTAPPAADAARQGHQRDVLTGPGGEQRFVQRHRRARGAFEEGAYQEAVTEGMAALQEAGSLGPAGARLVAQAHATLGEIHLAAGNYDLSASHLEQALAVDAIQQERLLLARTHRLAAETAMALDGFEQAAASLAKASALVQEGDPVLHRARLGLARARLAYLKGELEGADRAISAVRKLLTDNEYGRTLELVRAQLMAALLHGIAGDTEAANGLSSEALKLAVELLGKSHPAVAECQIQVATIALSQGRFSDAEELAGYARSTLMAALGEAHPLLVPVLNIEAAVAYSKDDGETVEQRYREALRIYQDAYGEEYSGLATYLNNLGMLLTSQQRYDEAVGLFTRALAIDEKTLGPDHIHLATTLSNLAILADSMGNEAEAERLYLRALVIQRKTPSRPPSEIASTLASLGTLYGSQERFPEAVAVYEEAVRALSTMGPTADANRGMITLGYADVLAAIDKLSEAETAYGKALDELGGALGPRHPYVALAHSALAEFYDAIDRVEEAQEQMELAAAIMQESGAGEDPDEN